MFLKRLFLLTLVVFTQCFLARGVIADTCSSGEYLNNDVCTTCPSGYFCPGDGSIAECSGNTISGDGASSCTDCKGDTRYSNSDHTQCIACNGDGEIEYNNDYCIVCAQGSYIKTENNSAVCTLCEVGYSCPGDGSRYKCSGNTISAEAGAASCTTCSDDMMPYANTDHTQCVACDDSATEYLNGSVCKTCGLGKYYGEKSIPDGMNIGDTNVGKDCLVCPVGMYCLGGSNYIPCPKGSYSANTGASSCLNCPFGYTTADVGATQCVAAEMKLKFNGTGKSLPSCLTKGRLNTDVIRNYSGTNVQNN